MIIDRRCCIGDGYCPGHCIYSSLAGTFLSFFFFFFCLQVFYVDVKHLPYPVIEVMEDGSGMGLQNGDISECWGCKAFVWSVAGACIRPIDHYAQQKFIYLFLPIPETSFPKQCFGDSV